MAISIPMEHSLPHEVRIILVNIGVDGRVDMMWGVRVGVDGATILRSDQSSSLCNYSLCVLPFGFNVKLWGQSVNDSSWLR